MGEASCQCVYRERQSVARVRGRSCCRACATRHRSRHRRTLAGCGLALGEHFDTSECGCVSIGLLLVLRTLGSAIAHLNRESGEWECDPTSRRRPRPTRKTSKLAAALRRSLSPNPSARQHRLQSPLELLQVFSIHCASETDRDSSYAKRVARRSVIQGEQIVA